MKQEAISSTEAFLQVKFGTMQPTFETEVSVVLIQRCVSLLHLWLIPAPKTLWGRTGRGQLYQDLELLIS